MGRKPPFNRTDREGLRKAEIAALSLLFLALGAALAWRGSGFLLDHGAAFPLLGVTLPPPAGAIAGILCLVLAAAVASATLAMWIRFR